MRTLLPSAFLVLVLGCGGDNERPPSLTYIWQAILIPNCATAGCHSALTRNGGINFSDRAEAYKALNTLNDRIFFGDYRPMADAEYFSRMPPDQPLPMADIELIQDWILAGYPDN